MSREFGEDKRREIAAIGELEDARAARRHCFGDFLGDLNVGVVKDRNKPSFDDCVEDLKP